MFKETVRGEISIRQYTTKLLICTEVPDDIYWSGKEVIVNITYWLELPLEIDRRTILLDP